MGVSRKTVCDIGQQARDAREAEGAATLKNALANILGTGGKADLVLNSAMNAKIKKQM